MEVKKANDFDQRAYLNIADFARINSLLGSAALLLTFTIKTPGRICGNSGISGGSREDECSGFSSVPDTLSWAVPGIGPSSPVPRKGHLTESH